MSTLKKPLNSSTINSLNTILSGNASRSLRAKFSQSSENVLQLLSKVKFLQYLFVTIRLQLSRSLSIMLISLTLKLREMLYPKFSKSLVKLMLIFSRVLSIVLLREAKSVCSLTKPCTRTTMEMDSTALSTDKQLELLEKVTKLPTLLPLTHSSSARFKRMMVQQRLAQSNSLILNTLSTAQKCNSLRLLHTRKTLHPSFERKKKNQRYILIYFIYCCNNSFLLSAAICLLYY